MSDLTRRTLLSGAGAVALGAAIPAGVATAAPRPAVQRATMLRWANDTWRCLDAMTDPHTGLIADNIDAGLRNRSGYTSPTNIGGYLWSTLVALRLGLIGEREATRRANRTLKTLKRMERHDESGMFYNWYDEATGEVLRVWPENGNEVVPFVSSVDMGWLGAATWAVRNALPGARRRADELWDDYRWDVFFDPDVAPAPGANYGGFYTENPTGRVSAAVVRRAPLHGDGGDDLWYTATHHYDTCVSEARMVIYLGIMKRQIPAGGYYATYRTFPPEWDWQELIPTGEPANHFGVEVYEGAYSYGGQRVVPGWGGSMFEELMPNLFVPEEKWAPRSWGRNHPGHVQAQIFHGMREAGYGYWGFSPSSNPAGGYREYGVDALGLKPDGYFSDQENTDYNRNSPPTKYGDGVVTPHAAFLAMMHAPAAAFANLRRLENNFDCYGRGGFFDAVAVRSGQVAQRYLSLDQAMVMGSLGNVGGGNVLQRAFATGDGMRIRPVIAPESFGR